MSLWLSSMTGLGTMTKKSLWLFLSSSHPPISSCTQGRDDGGAYAAVLCQRLGRTSRNFFYAAETGRQASDLCDVHLFGL